MVALYTARICEFFIERLCSGLWSGSFSVFSPSHPYFSSFHCFISVTGAWNGGSWLGCGDLPAMGAVFYLGAGWPQWKPLGIPGTHLPLKRGSWLNLGCDLRPCNFSTFLVCYGDLDILLCNRVSPYTSIYFIILCSTYTRLPLKSGLCKWQAPSSSWTSSVILSKITSQGIKATSTVTRLLVLHKCVSALYFNALLLKHLITL